MELFKLLATIEMMSEDLEAELLTGSYTLSGDSDSVLDFVYSNVELLDIAIERLDLVRDSLLGVSTAIIKKLNLIQAQKRRREELKDKTQEEIDEIINTETKMIESCAKLRPINKLDEWLMLEELKDSVKH